MAFDQILISISQGKDLLSDLSFLTICESFLVIFFSEQLILLDRVDAIVSDILFDIFVKIDVVFEERWRDFNSRMSEIRVLFFQNGTLFKGKKSRFLYHNFALEPFS